MPPTIQRALVSLTLWALTGCEAEEPERPGDPVPPEQQGECEPTASNGKLPSRPTFRASELQPLFDGERRATLTWAGWTGLADGESTLDVAIELNSEAVAARPGCATYVELPALVSLSSNDGLLDLEREAMVSAKSPSSAAVSVDIARDDAPNLDAALASRVVQLGDDRYPLELRLERDSFAGQLTLREHADAPACDVAAVPESRLCPLDVAERPLAEAVMGLNPSALAAEFSSAAALTLKSNDGETPLSLAVELDGERYCLQENVPDLAGMPSERMRVGLPVRVHATTADQKLDVWLPARLTLELDADGNWSERFLRAHAIAPTDSTATFDIALPELAVIELSLQMEESGPQGKLSVGQLSPIAPDLVLQDISPTCLSSQRLGQLREVASGTW